MSSKLIFFGGAGSVTGSNFMLDTGGAKFLIDCGLRQGRDEDEANNWDNFAYDPTSVSHLVITHAHIDHIGRIPKLVKDGFKGTILSTDATRALAEPLLHDAFEIMTHDAHKSGKDPLYAKEHIRQAFELWKPLEYKHPFDLPDNVTLELLDSGHILGSAMAQFSRNGVHVVVTGDLGGGNSPLLHTGETPKDAKYMVMESVYGDKKREDGNRREKLENIIEDAAARGGTLLIPAFSTERTQDLLFEIRTLMVEKRIPTMPLYVDSPLAEEITEVFIKNLPQGDVFKFPELHFVKTNEESQKLATEPNPKIILAGSGMGSGGRVGTHEQYILPDPKSTVCIVGYQAAGTIGRRLVEGASTISLWGSNVPVRCNVESIYGYSAHMDGEALLEFANKAAASGTLEQIFVVEGEPASASFLAQRIRDYLGIKATTPEAGDSAVIEF